MGLLEQIVLALIVSVLLAPFGVIIFENPED